MKKRVAKFGILLLLAIALFTMQLGFQEADAYWVHTCYYYRCTGYVDSSGCYVYTCDRYSKSYYHWSPFSHSWECPFDP